MPKTIHTPETPRLGELILPQTKLSEFKRVDAESATCKFHVNHRAALHLEAVQAISNGHLPGDTSSLEFLRYKASRVETSS